MFRERIGRHSRWGFLIVFPALGAFCCGPAIPARCGLRPFGGSGVAQAEERGLSPAERLRFHQERSGPIMDELRAWLRASSRKRK
jgi:hypothetical protein